MLNQTLIVQFHRFYETHLLAVRFLTGIFPNQLLSVREITPPIILANTGFALADFPQEWPHLLMSLEHIPFGSRQSLLSTGRPAVRGKPDVSHPLECASNALDRTRTCDPGIRNPLLYPAELRAQIVILVVFSTVILYSQSYAWNEVENNENR
jgi:hypothetical protein